MKNIEVVKRLNKNLETLLDRYDKLILMDDQMSAKKCIETSRLIKSTIELIDNLDFQPMSGTYGVVVDDNGTILRVISTWEQNTQGQTRNYRTWEVGNELDIETLKPLERGLVTKVNPIDEYIGDRARDLLRELKDLPNNKLIATDESMRGIGKTESLVRYATETNFSIVVKHNTKIDYIREYFDTKRDCIILIYNKIEDIRGIDADTLLFDEGFTEDEILLIKEKCNVSVGGFIRRQDLNDRLVD